MKTVTEKEIEREYDKLKFKHYQLQSDYNTLKGKYDQLCSQVKRRANNKRNEGDDFLRNYARGWD